MLLDRCRWDTPHLLIEFLKDNAEDIDVTYDDGICFQIAIANSSISILDILIKHFEKTKLTGDKESSDYKASKQKISQILQNAIQSQDVSEEIRERLKDYIQPEDTVTDNTLDFFNTQSGRTGSSQKEVDKFQFDIKEGVSILEKKEGCDQTKQKEVETEENEEQKIIARDSNEILEHWTHSFYCYSINMTGTKDQMLERFCRITCRFLYFAFFYQLLMFGIVLMEISFAIQNRKNNYVYLFVGLACFIFFGLLCCRWTFNQWEKEFAAKLFFATGSIRLRGVCHFLILQ